MTKALIVIDMLNDFVDPNGKLFVPDNRKILSAVAREIADARDDGDPIVYLCDAHADDDPEFEQWGPHAVKGSQGARVTAELEPQPGDSVVEKRHYSGFYDSELEETLKKLGADTVRITGCVSNICVLYTSVDAKMRGYQVEVVEDAVSGLDPDDHRFALKQLESVVGAVIAGKQ